MKAFVRNMKRPTHVSHRGGSLIAPENTLMAFRQAIETYATDQLEMDVQMTRDGVVVVVHDDTVDRTTDGTGAVAGLSAAELARLDAGYRFTADGGRTFPFRGRGVTIPRLDEVLNTTSVPLMIELKNPTDDCRRAVAELLRRFGAMDRVCIGARNDADAETLADELPEVALFYPDHAAREFVKAALFGGSPPATRYDVLALPDHERDLDLVNPRIIGAAKRAGIPIQLWTVDDAPRMRQCLAADVDGIQTDRPDILRAVMSELR